ncbi:hypothetical protein CPC08DRAFT_820968 [Agrocybe pediades]|nr:hypothetical protein CPC08DRAFT_820968 [Agrocybe pediades]
MNITESIGSGVPMIAWPFNADQPEGAYDLDEAGLGIELLQVRTGKNAKKPLFRNGKGAAGTREAVGAEMKDVIASCRGEKGARIRENVEKMKNKFLGSWEGEGEARKELTGQTADSSASPSLPSASTPQAQHHPSQRPPVSPPAPQTEDILVAHLARFGLDLTALQPLHLPPPSQYPPYPNPESPPPVSLPPPGPYPYYPTSPVPPFLPHGGQQPYSPPPSQPEPYTNPAGYVSPQPGHCITLLRPPDRTLITTLLQCPPFHLVEDISHPRLGLSCTIAETT